MGDNEESLGKIFIFGTRLCVLEYRPTYSVKISHFDHFFLRFVYPIDRLGLIFDKFFFPRLGENDVCLRTTNVFAIFFSGESPGWYSDVGLRFKRVRMLINVHFKFFWTNFFLFLPFHHIGAY